MHLDIIRVQRRTWLMNKFAINQINDRHVINARPLSRSFDDTKVRVGKSRESRISDGTVRKKVILCKFRPLPLWHLRSIPCRTEDWNPNPHLISLSNCCYVCAFASPGPQTALLHCTLIRPIYQSITILQSRYTILRVWIGPVTLESSWGLVRNCWFSLATMR